MADLAADFDTSRRPNHWVQAMGLALTERHGRTHGHAELVPEMFAPGTERLRMGVLATMIDVVGGMPPERTLHPTVDLRVTLLRPPPTKGVLHLACQPLKWGRSLYWAEVPVHEEGRTEPFAVGTVTFLVRESPSFHGGFFSGRKGPVPTPSFDALLGARHPAPGISELERHPAVSNGPGGTVQGGAQVAFAEVAIEHALAPRGAFTVTDIEIRYLSAMKGDVLRAQPLLVDAFGAVDARVALTDPAADDRPVALVQAIARPV